MALTDSQTILDRQEALEAARRRMQESHDAKAAKFAEEQKLVRFLLKGMCDLGGSLQTCFSSGAEPYLRVTSWPADPPPVPSSHAL